MCKNFAIKGHLILTILVEGSPSSSVTKNSFSTKHQLQVQTNKLNIKKLLILSVYSN